MERLPPDHLFTHTPSHAATTTRGDAEASQFGFRTACWMKISYPTLGVRDVIAPLPPARLLRHGDFVHVLYDVDAWSRAGCITREDVVARLRNALFTQEIAHEMALGHFVCESDDPNGDADEIREAMRSV